MTSDAIIGIPDVTTQTTKTEPKLQQTATITLNGPNDSLLQIVAERKGDGAKSYIITTTDKKSVRGMTEVHATFEAAKAATEKLATQAAKIGWRRKEARRGFVAKPDAFTTIPAPPKAKK